MTTASDLVNGYMLRRFREYPRGDKHLVACSDAHLVHADAEDGMCGEGTCDFVYFDTKVACPHGFESNYRFEMAGTLGELIEDLAEEPIRQAKSEADEAARIAEAKQLAKVQRATMVALFDGDTQVTDWVPFADGKAPVPESWTDTRATPHSVKVRGNALRMRTRDGKPLRASTSVQEHIVRSYAITWRTVW